jgi:hypothetical protein
MLSINDSEARHKATYRLGFGPHCRNPMDLLWIYSFWYKIKGWKMIGLWGSALRLWTWFCDVLCTLIIIHKLGIPWYMNICIYFYYKMSKLVWYWLLQLLNALNYVLHNVSCSQQRISIMRSIKTKLEAPRTSGHQTFNPCQMREAESVLRCRLAIFNVKDMNCW